MRIAADLRKRAGKPPLKSSPDQGLQTLRQRDGLGEARSTHSPPPAMSNPLPWLLVVDRAAMI